MISLSVNTDENHRLLVKNLGFLDQELRNILLTHTSNKAETIKCNAWFLSSETPMVPCSQLLAPPLLSLFYLPMLYLHKIKPVGCFLGLGRCGMFLAPSTELPGGLLAKQPGAEHTSLAQKVAIFLGRATRRNAAKVVKGTRIACTTSSCQASNVKCQLNVNHTQIRSNWC